MAFFAYLITILVTAGSLVLGFEWLVTPPPLPDHPIKVAQADAPQQPRRETEGASKRTEKRTEKRSDDADDIATANRTDGGAAKREQTASAASETQSHPRCDVRACDRAYRSFRTSDCTYQPYDGPRRLCTRGDNRMTAIERTEGFNARAQAQCNVGVCAEHYNSFRASDCTYQPYGGGPRRLCER